MCLANDFGKISYKLSFIILTFDFLKAWLRFFFVFNAINLGTSAGAFTTIGINYVDLIVSK